MTDLPLPPFRRAFDTARDPYTARNALGITSLGGGGISDAPSDGTLYGRQNGAWAAAQPLDGDLTSLAAASSVAIYYRSAANTWGPVTIGTGLSFAGGTLSCTGNQTITLSGDVGGSGTTAITTTIANNAVTNAKLADVATATFKGRTTAGTGDPEDLTATQATALLNTFTSSLKGLAPSSGGGTTTFLRADGTWAAPTVSPTEVTSAGRLTYSSPTALLFKPFAGNKIKINGALLTIPNAGIAGLTNTGCNVNTVAGQNLAANTTYAIFAFNNSGTITATFFTDISHTPSTTLGNEGVEISPGFDAYSLIGMVRTNASGQFVDSAAVRGVLSWFNRRPRVAQGKFTTNRSTTSTSNVEINSEIAVGFLTWAESAVVLATAGTTWCSTIGTGSTQIYVDGTSATGYVAGTSAAAGYTLPISMTAALGGLDALTEGYHSATLYGSTNAGTQNWAGGAGPGACTLTAQIDG